MLLDPFEKQFHLPAALVELRDGQRGQSEIVGQKDERRSGCGRRRTRCGAADRGTTATNWPGQDDGLIAAQAGGLVDRAIDVAGVEIPFGARHEESARLVQAIQSGEIDVAAIHDVERTRFDRQMIEDRDIVHFPVGNMDKTGNVAAQIQQRVQLDGAFATAKRGPRKQARHKSMVVESSA